MRSRSRLALAGTVAGLTVTLLASCSSSPTPTPTYASPTADSATLGVTLTAATAKDALPAANAIGAGWQRTSSDVGASELTSELGAVSFQPSSCNLSTGLEAVFPSDGLAAHAGEVYTGTGLKLPKYASADVRSYSRELTAKDLAKVTSFVKSCPTVQGSAFGQSVSANLSEVTPTTSYGDETLAIRIRFGGSASGGSASALSGTIDLTCVRVGHTIVSVLSVGVGGAQTQSGDTLTAAAMAQLQTVTAG